MIVAVGMFGCASPKEKVTKSSPDKKISSQTINARDFSDEYKGEKNELLWNLKVDVGRFIVPQSGSKRGTTGSGTDVSGEIFDKGKVNCRYKAAHGDAINSPMNRTLTLSGHVEIDAVDPPGRLICDHLVYDGIKRFFKATGHVQVLGTLGTKGTLDEVWATPDLTKIASPQLFNQP